jgi:hypothetical protein
MYTPRYQGIKLGTCQNTNGRARCYVISYCDHRLALTPLLDNIIHTSIATPPQLLGEHAHSMFQIKYSSLALIQLPAHRT